MAAADDVVLNATQIYKVGLGFVTAATSTYFLCNLPPQIIKRHVNFPEVKRLSFVLIAIFAMLIVGGFGHPGQTELGWIAVAATVIGVGLFFSVLHHAKRFKPAAVPLWIMFLFFLYTCSISCGLTSASVCVLLRSSSTPTPAVSQAPKTERAK